MAAALDAAEAWQSVPRVRPPRSLFDSPPAFATEADYAFATPRARRKARPPGNSQTRLHFMPSMRDYEPEEAHPACESCGVLPGEGLCRGCTDFLCRACCLGAKREGRLCVSCGLACSSCTRAPESRRALAARACEGDGKGQSCRGCAAALASPAAAPRGRTPRAGEERTPVAASCAAPERAGGGGSGHVGRRRSLAALAPATAAEPAPKRRR